VAGDIRYIRNEVLAGCDQIHQIAARIFLRDRTAESFDAEVLVIDRRYERVLNVAG
jgi:hypothetical protein